MTTDAATPVGFTADEIRTDEPTRRARLKWVVVVDTALPAGRAVNAAVCAAAATARAVNGLLGPDAHDADGHVHPGLPWAGCSVLGADADQLLAIRSRAEASEGVHVADMPLAAATTRVYDEYLARVGQSPAGELACCAVSLVGPRNRIDKIVRGSELLP